MIAFEVTRRMSSHVLISIHDFISRHFAVEHTKHTKRPLTAAGGPKTRWMEISVWNLALFVAFESWSFIDPGNWHILPWEKEDHRLKHALGPGDILVPRKARASTKKLYVIASFCTRTFRTLIFPLVLSSTIYVPISLSLLKLQEKHQSFRILMYKSSHVLVKSLVKSNDQLIYHGI